MTLGDYAWVTLGSTLGGVMRYWASGLIARRFGESFPWGTLFVNVTGSFIIGLAAALGGPDAALLGGPRVRLLVTAGICGGYTTFSSFSLQTLTLAREGEWRAALSNVLLSTGACLAAACVGLIAGRALTPS
jgi:CrcB protein